MSILWFDSAESVTYSMGYFEEGDVIIENDTVVIPDGDSEILMNGPVHLYNRGCINGTINTNGYNLFVYNSGQINGIINSDGGHVTQVIHSGADVTDINISDNQSPDIVIENYNNFNFDNIHNINAESITIRESSVVIDDFSKWQSCTENMQLSGNVSLIINHADTVNSGEVINYTVSGDTISVQITDLDKMYKPELVVANGGIVLNIVRETNYDVIFGDSYSTENQRNAALELIRRKHPNDRLLKALDVATDIDTINHLKSLSYRFNHDILLHPMKMTGRILLIDSMKYDDNIGIGFVPHYITSDKMDSVGGRVYAGYKYDNLYFNIGFSLNNVHYVDDLNDFSGISYGLDLKARQTFNKFWLREMLGFSLMDYRAEYISSKGELRKNPLGLSLYGDVATGYDFDVSRNITLSPIVGVSYQSYQVADVNDADTFGHGGADVKYTFVMDSIKYEYSVYGGIGTNGDVFANMKIGFISMPDDAGVSLNVGVVKDDLDYYYQFGLNAKVVF